MRDVQDRRGDSDACGAPRRVLREHRRSTGSLSLSPLEVRRHSRLCSKCWRAWRRQELGVAGLVGAVGDFLAEAGFFETDFSLFEFRW